MLFYEKIINHLKNSENFKFSRWGDGEWMCMLGFEGQNRDGNHYIPQLGEDLMKILISNPNYYLGIQYGLFYGQLREAVIKALFTLNIDWQNGDVLHQASEFGQLDRLNEVLLRRNVTVIGADYFKKLNFNHIEIPPEDSYLYNETLFKKLKPKKDEVYLVAAAMNSNIIIDKLPNFVTAIDIGSVYDPYLGIRRAGYQKKMNLKTNLNV
jgi:hypothetical protein